MTSRESFTCALICGALQFVANVFWSRALHLAARDADGQYTTFGDHTVFRRMLPANLVITILYCTMLKILER